MTSTLFEHSRPAAQTLLQSFGTVLSRCVHTLLQHGEKRRAAQHLMSSPDHLLRDIGINRRQIMAAVHGRPPIGGCHDADR